MPTPMRPFSLRRLTGGETALAREMFGSALDAACVRILAIPVWNRAFVAGPRLIVWPARGALSDFSEGSLAAQGMLIHELTHVWQAQTGVSLILGKLRAGDSAASYAYDLTGGPGFLLMNIEQQAMVIEHAFLASRGVEVPYPPALYGDAVSCCRRD